MWCFIWYEQCVRWWMCIVVCCCCVLLPKLQRLGGAHEGKGSDRGMEPSPSVEARVRSDAVPPGHRATLAHTVVGRSRRADGWDRRKRACVDVCLGGWVGWEGRKQGLGGIRSLNLF